MQLKKWLIYLAVTIAGSVLLVGALTWQQYHAILHEHRQQVIKDSFVQLEYSAREYKELEAQFTTTMELLAGSHQVQDYLRAPDPALKAYIEDAWLSIAVAQDWFRHIALITPDGQEQVVIGSADDSTTLMPVEAGQTNPDVLQFARRVKAGNVGVWGVEISGRDTASSLNPVITLLVPVHSKRQRIGYVIARVDLWTVSDVLEYSPNREYVPEVLDVSGFYLVSKDKNKLFGFLLPSRSVHSFARLYPQIWSKVLREPAGFDYAYDNLFIYTQVNFFHGDRLFLILQFSEEQLLEQVSSRLHVLFSRAMFGLASLFLFAFPAAYLIQIYHKRSLESKLARAAIDGMSAVLIADSRMRVIMVNREFEKLVGHEFNSIKGANALSLLSPKHGQEQLHTMATGLRKNGIWEGELKMMRSDGGSSVSITRIQRISSSKLASRYFICSFVDISERKELEEQLRHLSERDSLTGCWNRRKFEQEQAKQSRLCERYNGKYQACLALVDIDHFKRINDQYGHDQGDIVIQSVARILGEQLRECDFLARIGGEEFALLLPNTDLEGAMVLLNRLLVAVASESEYRVTVSIGVTDIRGDSARAYKLADIALYDSKSGGRNRVSACDGDSDLA